MTSDIRRHWQLALATLVIWCAAGLVGSIVQAADDASAQASDPASEALAEQLDALVEQAARRVGRQGAEGAAPDAEVVALREQLQAAETQIALLKNVVIQALRAQSAAEEALRREQAEGGTTPAPEAAPEPVGRADPALADQVAALTDTVRRLRADLEALRARTPSEPTAEGDPASVIEEDAMLSESGMGGQYEPLLEDERVEPGGGDTAAIGSGDPIKIAEVHFNSGSAELTAGGERRTLEAVERIRSMEPAKVRVVAFADRVGGAAYNRVLSQRRALSIAALIESVGLPREMVEVVGSGEDGLPVPTPDGVPEPLNRCAGIFVVPQPAG